MEREEAIERIKTRFDKWALDNEDMKAIQTIIPELAESEDERIRKVLLELVSNDKTNGYTKFYEENGITCDDAIAYLEKQKKSDIPCSKYVEEAVDAFETEYEKQKEQKPLDIPPGGSGARCTTPPSYKLDVKPSKQSDNERVKDAIRQCVFDMRGEFEKLYHVSYEDVLAYLENADEQKPAELSEFELKVQEILYSDKPEYSASDPESWKHAAYELLSLARKEIEKDLPRWKKCVKPGRFHTFGFGIGRHKDDGEVIFKNGWEISVRELIDNLPKED